jgi:hypothetical protein
MPILKKYNLSICNNCTYNNVNSNELKNHINNYFKNILLCDYQLTNNQIHNIIKCQNIITSENGSKTKRKIHPLLVKMIKITEIKSST